MTAPKVWLVIALLVWGCILVSSSALAQDVRDVTPGEEEETETVPDDQPGTSDGPRCDPAEEDCGPPRDDRPRRPRGGGGGGIGVGIDLSRLLGARSRPPEPAKFLEDEGPQFPASYSMSLFAVQGFAKGAWPMVIDYEVEPGSFAFVTVAADGVEPLYYRLDDSRQGRHYEILKLPERFGKSPSPAAYVVRSLSARPGEMKPGFLRIYGLGAGDKAVGSVSIDSLQFRPGSIQPKRKQKAAFSFRAREAFKDVEAEFYRVGLANDGQIVATRVDGQKIKKGVRRDERIKQEWDGKTDEGETSQGQHLLQVRAWRSLKEGGDWVAAQSAELVRVE